MSELVDAKLSNVKNFLREKVSACRQKINEVDPGEVADVLTDYQLMFSGVLEAYRVIGFQAAVDAVDAVKGWVSKEIDARETAAAMDEALGS